MAKKAKKKNQEKNSEEFSVDLSSVKNFFKKINLKKNSAWITLIVLLIPLLFSIYFRSYTYSLPATDDWAYNSVISSLRSQIAADINAKYPNLPSSNKNQLIDEQLNTQIKTYEQEIKSSANQLSIELKSNFQDETGQTYLLAIDSYYYYKYTKNLVEYGHLGDSLKDGKPYSSLRLAPLGRKADKNLLPYLQANIHKLMSLFTDNSLMKNVFLIPIILSALCIIPVFFIAKRKAGLFGGFIAAMILAVQSAFLGRTPGGFSDTDAFNVLFPLFIVWLFLEAFESKDLKKQILLSLGAGFFVGVYSFAWSGWWFIFDFLLGIAFVYIAYTVLKTLITNKKFKNLWNENLKNTLIVIVSFLIFSGLFVSLISSFSTFQNFFSAPLRFTVIKQASKPDLWPNVYTTVAELNPASISTIIKQLDGKLMFLLAGIGIILTLIKKKNLDLTDYLIISFGSLTFLLLISDRIISLSSITYIIIMLLPIVFATTLLLFKDKTAIDIKYALLLSVWFVSTVYASTKGVRFVLLMVPAFSIAIGVFVGMAHTILTDITTKEFKINKKIISTIFIILLLLLLVRPMRAADQTAKGQVPSMNDAWWDTLTGIKTNSSEDAIITSWWDFGHWFRAIAERKVTFDGASQNSPQAHWVGKLLLTSNEEEAIGILRMLDCGANNAFEEIDEEYNDTETSINLVYEIIIKNKEEAKELLKEKGFSDQKIELILDYSHCEPPEALLITSGDMVGKSGVWAHFGSWDFQKAYIYNNVRRKSYQEAVPKLMNRFNFTEEQASGYYYEVQSLTNDEQVNSWIAPWPSYATSLSNCNELETEIQCSFNINIGQSNIAQKVVISGVIINKSDYHDTNFILSFIDTNTGLIVGQQKSKPKNLVFASEEMETYKLTGAEIDLDVVYDSIAKKALVTNPELSKSMFTRLFYLEGKYTDHFERFSDKTSVFGDRIIVWKVGWEGKQSIAGNEQKINTGVNIISLEESLAEE